MQTWLSLCINKTIIWLDAHPALNGTIRPTTGEGTHEVEVAECAGMELGEAWQELDGLDADLGAAVVLQTEDLLPHRLEVLQHEIICNGATHEYIRGGCVQAP